MKMDRVIVYLSEDYKQSESFYISGGLSKDEITKEVNERFTEWFYYDIV